MVVAHYVAVAGTPSNLEILVKSTDGEITSKIKQNTITSSMKVIRAAAADLPRAWVRFVPRDETPS